MNGFRHVHSLVPIMLLGTILVSARSVAQSTGQVRLLMEPAGTTSYLLDNEHRMVQRELNLLEGPHRFVFWAPERKMLDTTITVVPDRVTEVRIVLRYAEEYISYRDDLRRYERGHGLVRHVPVVVAGAAAIWAGASLIRWGKADRTLSDAEEAYITLADPGDIADLKGKRIPDAKQDFRNARAQFIVASGVFALSAGATWFVRERAKDRQPPTYEDKERIRFEGLTGWNEGPGRAGLLATFSLSIR